MNTPLTYTHFRFEARAVQPIRLGGYQGAERLRDALAQVMLRAVCPETLQREKPTPEHAAVCPACWLLAAEVTPGTVRRVYALAGPQPPLDTLTPGQDFHFTITLFGEGFNFLPYFVLAASAMGDVGVGPGRRKFAIRAIHALNPLRGESRTVLAEGERVVRPHSLPIGWEEALRAARQYPPQGDVRLRFLSPTRLIDSDSLVKAPDFGIFFRRLLERVDELAKQHNGAARRPPEEMRELYALADRVRLVDQSIRWVEMWGPSGRTGRNTPMGGFVGWAVYRSQDWERLLPWLLLGQGVQVGKLTAKGNGVFQVEAGEGGRGFWL
ncbi:MAG: CRISPR system precrRNA processing endoribonuclease RAMP protein Cas6 [Candidatus Villigracilaceae bacterium]